MLAYSDPELVGWAGRSLRADLPLARSGEIPRGDDLPVWWAWCFLAGRANSVSGGVPRVVMRRKPRRWLAGAFR